MADLTDEDVQIAIVVEIAEAKVAADPEVLEGGNASRVSWRLGGLEFGFDSVSFRDCPARREIFRRSSSTD